MELYAGVSRGADSQGKLKKDLGASGFLSAAGGAAQGTAQTSASMRIPSAPADTPCDRMPRPAAEGFPGQA